MFGNKRLKTKVERLQLENEELTYENNRLKEKLEDLAEMKTMTDAFFHLIGSGFDDICIRLNKQDISIIEIQTVMQAGGVDEFTVGMLYAVNVYVTDLSGAKGKIATIPVMSQGDGCFISPIASKRRQLKFEFSKSIARFVQMQIEYTNIRIGAKFEIIQTEDVIDELLKIPEGNDEE